MSASPQSVANKQDADDHIIRALQRGLPLSPQPYKELAQQLQMPESTLLATLQRWLQHGIIRRLGVIVRHRELGYTANGMVVWDVPDAIVDEIGTRMGQFDFVTLCYRRPRCLPDWPYNLFCMIHGQQRTQVQQHVITIQTSLGADFPHDILFSSHCYKQRGAHYRS